jgi:hypothetical protein
MVVVTPASSSITNLQPLQVTVSVSAAGGKPTGSVTLTSDSYASGATILNNGSVSITIPAGVLRTGTDTLLATYTPDSTGATLYTAASGTASLSVTVQTFVLTVNSATPSSGISIAVSPSDVNGSAAGTTGFARVYDAGKAVLLNAPSALVSGLVIDNWWTFFYSEADVTSGYSKAPCYKPWGNPADREAHSGIPMIEYYLQQFNTYSQKYGMRLLDYLGVHGYFEPHYNGSLVGLTTAGDTAEQTARLNGTRVFWDPTYTDATFPQPNYITDSNYTSSCSPPAQAPQLVPMLQGWVEKDYPGTKVAIDEYNFAVWNRSTER